MRRLLKFKRETSKKNEDFPFVFGGRLILVSFLKVKDMKHLIKVQRYAIPVKCQNSISKAMTAGAVGVRKKRRMPRAAEEQR